eukprot:CAMPEP_0205999864 /NCGR_PEP_ID=MMETSP1464-20131121/1118_1 /ASSEMBLY_ACC=CAM_ASM_001124 /TAXON_ID=119497 /ORGANISM="Exanthemachrysis gayraliae, Strain RCC1523" /LENGTH=49 /DNA_ID= /DNA_START= /DNA_END= /DNA_ORIENTATION=
MKAWVHRRARELAAAVERGLPEWSESSAPQGTQEPAYRRARPPRAAWQG